MPTLTVNIRQTVTDSPILQSILQSAFLVGVSDQVREPVVRVGATALRNAKTAGSETMQRNAKYTHKMLDFHTSIWLEYGLLADYFRARTDRMAE